MFFENKILKGATSNKCPHCDDHLVQLSLVEEMVVGPDANERDAVCLRLVNSTETRPFSSCGHAAVQRLMFKEKGGAAFSKEAFYIDATRHGVEGCGMQSGCKRGRERQKGKKRYHSWNN